MDTAHDREGNLLAPIQKGHVMKFLKNLRRTFAEDAPQVPTPTTTPQNITVTVADHSDKYHLTDYIDQTAIGTFELLSVGELTRLRNDFITVTGAPPPMPNALQMSS